MSKLVEKYIEIKQPDDMIPIITKDRSILWYNAKYVRANSIRNVDVLLYDKFAKVFNGLKLYIDSFNFICFAYKKEIEFINNNCEKYDNEYDLNKDLYEKVETYKECMEKYLDIIHNLFNDYYKMIERVHVEHGERK